MIKVAFFSIFCPIFSHNSSHPEADPDAQEVQGEERPLLDGQQGPQLHDDHRLLVDRS